MGPLSNHKEDLMSKLAGYSSPGPSSVASSDGAKGFDPWSFFVDLLKIGSNIYANNRNIELAREQNRWNIAQWQRENAYNTPSAQMARLAAAGINPALAYSNGDIMNEAANSPQLTSGQVMSPVQIDSLTQAQVANLEANTAKTKSEIPINEQTALHIQEQIKTLQDQFASRRIERLKSFEEFNQLLNSNNLFYETFDSQVQQIKSQSEISRVQAENITSMIDAQLKTLTEQANAFKSSAAYMDAQSDVAKAAKAQLDEVLKQLQAQTEIINKQRDLILKYGSVKEVMGLINTTLSATAQMTNALANVAGTIMSKGQSPRVNMPSTFNFEGYESY